MPLKKTIKYSTGNFYPCIHVFFQVKRLCFEYFFFPYSIFLLHNTPVTVLMQITSYQIISVCVRVSLCARECVKLNGVLLLIETVQLASYVVWVVKSSQHPLCLHHSFCECFYQLYCVSTISSAYLLEPYGLCLCSSLSLSFLLQVFLDS